LDLLEELNDRITQLSVTFIKHLNTKIALPESMLTYLEQKIEEISTLLEDKRNSFVASLKKDLNESISKLKNDLKNKEASKRRDLALIDEINSFKEGL